MIDVSIIITCEEEGQQKLRQLLPELLSMRYESDFEVIVVDKQNDKDMREWLEEMEVHYPNLSHTFCPASSRGIDIHRLALTLGAKAANYEWLVILSADDILTDEDWLPKLASCCSDETDIVLGIPGGKRRLNRFTSYLLRRRFSLFRPSSFVILCRRSILLHESSSVPQKRIISLPL